MKKNYFIWSVILGLFSGAGNAQSAYMDGDVKVYNSSKTLMYFGQDLEIKTDGESGVFFENHGNVYIRGNYKNVENSDLRERGKNFVSTWDEEGQYGQVIINDGSNANGWLTLQYRAVDPGIFDYIPYGVPYHWELNKQENVKGLFSFLDDPEIDFSEPRYKEFAMAWDNVTQDDPRFDGVSTANAVAGMNTVEYVNPTTFMIFNLMNWGNTPAALHAYYNANDKVLHSGLPANEPHSSEMNGNQYSGTDVWNVWKDERNVYGEFYWTYIDDNVRPDSEDEYGKNVFQFGNPYTSNLDLSKLGDGTFGEVDLRAISKPKLDIPIDWNSSTGTEQQNGPANVHRATLENGVWAGNAEALLIRPYEAFAIHLTGDSTMSELDFNDDLKTFEDLADLSNFDPNGKMMNSEFYQLNLKLYDAEGNDTSNHVYVAVTPIVENGVENLLESEFPEFSDDGTGFYLGQENALGLSTTTSDRKMHINAINTDFVGKPIPLFFNRNDINFGKSFTAKAELFQGNIFSKLSAEEVNFDDGNTFLFYDNDKDILLPITTDFSYDIAGDVQSGTPFTLYWNQGPEGEMGIGELYVGRTIVYKDGDVHKVRFNEAWNTADVSVYDVSGRRINTYKDVNTNNDLVLRLLGNGVYIVKAVSEKGEVHTQKILK